ncbi:MAG TPA: oligosaccharide flippase family protein [Nocardioides sp.]|jgi:O-antigen/teichoic acid export membrane protein|nr:oligosaccharide flippase family protein [Nocardioides sp.]
MSRGRAVAGSAAVLVGSQVVVTVVQVGTGAATARLLAPAAFGTFAAAMAITGLLGVVLTSATATAVLREHELTPARVSKLWASAGIQGALGAAVTWLAAPAWAALYDTPDAVTLVRWLAIQVGLSPLAVTSSALLRRERRAFADGVTQGGSVVVGLLVGLAAVWIWREGVLLVVSPIVAVITLLVGTLVLRRERYPWESPDKAWSVRRANTQIVLQNLYFFVLSAVPVWLVSQAGSSHELGLFSRASAIPSMVVGAVTVGLVRSAQPYYRSVAEENRGSALRDLVVMTGAIGIPVMTVIAATADPLLTVWLGPRWVDGARYVPLVAAGSAVYLMFTLLANAAETLSYLKEVRFAQLAMLPALLAVAAVSFGLGSAMLAAATMLVVALPGLATLVVVLVRRGLDHLGGALRATALQLGVGVVIGGAGWLCAQATGDLGSWPSLVLSGALVAVLFVVTLPLRPEWSVMRSRGLLPRQFSRSVDASSGASL